MASFLGFREFRGGVQLLSGSVVSGSVVGGVRASAETHPWSAAV